MENASKALIIAGAILLAIVIISLGLIVVNNTRSTVDNANMDEQEIQNFNAKFTAYEGKAVDGSKVNTLISAIIASNQAETKKGTGRTIQFTVNSGTYDSSNTATKAAATYSSSSTSFFKASISKQYQVTITYSNGLVNAITIQNKV